MLHSLLLLLALAQVPQEPSAISTREAIAEDLTQIPCKTKDRLLRAKDLFEKAQAPGARIAIEKRNGVENLLVRHEGSSEEVIVIGAHYDLAALGCGAIDNWTGIVAIAHLYRTISRFNPQKDVLFVAFGKEEVGLLGSKAIVDTIPKGQIPNYCAMINIDSLGLGAPHALEGSSSKKLVVLAETVSKEMNIPFASVRIAGADSDSTSFIKKTIPAVTLSGLSNEWQSILHRTRDQVARIIPESVYLGYQLALAMWSRIEQAPCDAFR